jgi:predicted Zn-dependent peptidase
MIEVFLFLLPSLKTELVTEKSMKKFRLLCLAGLLSANGLLAQTSKIQFVEYDLPNGLHVILHEDHSTPIVAISVLYHVGSKNEDPTRTGFAHFFEHLLFEGTENIKRGEFDKYIQGAGGVNNANTSQDRTFYYEILASNELELGLWMESERMLHAKIEDIGVETQRQVVKEEKRQRMDNQPYGNIMTELFQVAYTTHPYKWMPIGSMEHLDAAKLGEFMDFYKTYYVPNNATLSIAGDLNIEQSKQLIEKYFKDIPTGKAIPRPTIKEPVQTKEIRHTAYDAQIQLPAILYAYHIPAQGTDDYYALQMLNTWLAGGESSQMNKELVDNQQKALQIFAFPFPLEDPGLFLVGGIAALEVSADDLDKLMDIEIEKVKNTLISDREFEKIRNQTESAFVTQNSTVVGVAENLANYHVYYGDANLINTEIDRYMKVTKEDIKRVANQYLVKNNRVVLHYLPKK